MNASLREASSAWISSLVATFLTPVGVAPHPAVKQGQGRRSLSAVAANYTPQGTPSEVLWIA